MSKTLKLAALAVLGALIGGGLGFGLAWTFDNAPAEVKAKYIAYYQGEPIPRWMLDVDSIRGSEAVEIGPALYDCFEVGDVFTPGSVGRCEGVVWP